MSEPVEETVQVSKKDMDELMELLGGYKTMLLGHERRLGIIEKVLIEAAKPDRPNQDLTRRRT